MQGGCCACGGGCLQICGAHSPHQTPLATLCLWATVTAPSTTDHAWPCLRLGRGGSHFCVSPRLLAPAACRVPGGLIKFDLFFSRQSILPPPPLARRPLFCPLRPWGVSDCLSACAQLRAKPGTQNGGGCSSAARLQGAGIPGSCHAALAPNLPPKSRPSPLPFASLEPGAEPPREECVNFLTGGKLSSPGMGCFPAGSAGCAWLCLYIGPTKSEGPRFLSRGPVTRASVQRKEARKISFFFS